MKKLLVFVIICFAVSCKKDDPAPEPTRDQLLIGATKGWAITSATISPAITIGGASITDFFSQMDACDKDDLIIFTTAKYQVENPVKCDSTEPSIVESGSWTLSSSKDIISLKPDGDTAYEFTIVNLSATLLTASQVLDLGTGVKYTITTGYKPK